MLWYAGADPGFQARGGGRFNLDGRSPQVPHLRGWVGGWIQILGRLQSIFVYVGLGGEPI